MGENSGNVDLEKIIKNGRGETAATRLSVRMEESTSGFFLVCFCFVCVCVC